jgi:N-acyl homoserine lactone hydrolase
MTTRDAGAHMKIHAFRTGEAAVHPRHINPVRGPLRRMLPLVERRWITPLPIFCWLVEHPEGPILIDAGAAAAAEERDYFPRWHPFYRRAIRFSMGDDPEVTGWLAQRAISPDEVSVVVLTHLHWDHVGGLDAFRHARVLVAAKELEEARGWAGRVRGYLPERWPGSLTTIPVTFDGPPLGRFPASAAVTHSGDVTLLPTPGHTRGHLSVLIDGEDLSWLIAGDASYTQQLMLARTVDAVSPDARAARESLRRINELLTRRPTVYLPSHDPEAADRLAQGKAARPTCHFG